MKKVKEESQQENYDNLKMKIIFCGNKIDKKLFNLIIIDKDKDELFTFDNYSEEGYITKSILKPKWDFLLFEDGFDEKQRETIYKIIYKNFSSKGKEGESIIVFFTEEDDDDKGLLDFFDDKNTYFHPFIIFISSNKNKNKEYYDNYIKNNDLDFDERNIEIFNKEDSNIREKILRKLWKACCYYNEIGDNIVFPELEIVGAKKELNVKYNNCLNIFITGKPGAGKSTTVNVICREKKAKEKSGGPSVTSHVIKYFIGDSPIALYDTPGYISRYDIENLMKTIEKKNQEIYDNKEQIHGIFYVIDINSSRTLEEGELLLINFIIKCKIPLFFLLNRSKINPNNKNKKNKRNNYLESFLEILEKKYPDKDVSKYIYPINLKNDNEGNIIFGLDKLFQDLYDYYFPHKVNIEELNYNFETEKYILSAISHSIFFKNIKSLKDALKLSRIQAEHAIKGSIASSFFFGSIPIPIQDKITISSIQIILCTTILTIYGYKINKFETNTFLKGYSLTTVSAFTGYGIFSLLCPFLGATIILPIIKGGIASLTTYFIGKKCIQYCEDNFKEQNAIEFFRNLAYNYNNAIDDLKKISDSFKIENYN